MITWINEIADKWWAFFPLFTLQNSLFILFVFLIVFLARDRQAVLVRAILLVGLLKLFVPPFYTIKTEFALLPITFGTGPVLLDVQPAIPSSPVVLTSGSYFFIGWFLFFLLLISFAVLNHLKLNARLKKCDKIKLNENIAGIVLLPKMEVYQSPVEQSPFITGFFKPKLILPASWASLSNKQKRIIIQHETAHLHLKDNWIGLFNILAIALHFFNPLVWMLIKRLREASEKACDDYAVYATDKKPAGYVKELLSISENISNNLPGLVNTHPFSRSHKKLKGRINYQLNKKENTRMKWKSKNVFLVSLAMGLLFLACSVTNPQKVKSKLTEKRSEKINEKINSPQNGFVAFSDLDVKPKMLKKPAPKYPDAARKAEIKGRVILIALIDEAGNVASVDILKSPHPSLGAAAKEAAMQIKFTPGEKDGKKVKCKMAVPYVFGLKKDGGDKNPLNMREFKNEQEAKTAYQGFLDELSRANSNGNLVKVNKLFSFGDESVLFKISETRYLFHARQGTKVFNMNASSVDEIKDQFKK